MGTAARTSLTCQTFYAELLERLNRIKARKDVHQAAQLCEALLETRPGDLSLAWQALVTRGKGWTRRFEEGLDALAKEFPSIAKDLGRYLTAKAQP